MKRSNTFFVCLLVLLTGFIASLVDVAIESGQGFPQAAASADLVSRLGLTDLALFTEARYTRHPSQTDIHSAFQDHPVALEHFPTGSLLQPPIDSLP
ncbi:MAG: hypothetical protein JAY99_14625 [Candidatus Thiodiazotropha lotti]|nr:hypothetical protein [Candidatus Thiodiazotropha weberae]MCG7993147.1 hypothetical protein [Candidatus Thiodiazotropha lotti]MCG7915443.1 hypothetical protein [Candidatus Thiodiazotropha weberae]MCG8000753.1 hypothetical protein [Candidatus Thiodiazotropha lotti]MCW4184809.1 hypothetical protein [Candidatus Thiodiazotropha weberae]